jgi:polyisoprenoid-binding protein YceI
MKPARAALPLAAALALCACAGLSGLAEPGTYAVDPTHTSVTFEVAHFGTSTSRGRFERAQGEVQIDDTGGKGGRVEIRMATASVSTGVPALDGRLRGPDFLDSAAFPEATFVGERFTFSGGKVSEVAGSLTLRGKTLPLALKASHFNCYVSPLLVRQVCGGDFEATLQPSRWGVEGHLSIGIADEVRLLVQVEAIRQ